MPDITEALAAFRSSDPERALGLCESLLAVSPRDSSVLTIKALSLAMSGVPKEAAEIFRLLSRQEPHETEHRMNLASALRDSGQSEAALKELESALGTKADSLDLRVQLAAYLSERGEFARCVELLIRVAQVHPENLAVRALLARAKNETAGPQSARAALGPPENFDAASAEIAALAGLVLTQLGDLGAAETLLYGALDREPGCEDARFNLIALLERSNQLDQLVTLLDESPLARTAEQALILARANRRLKRLSAARQLLEESRSQLASVRAETVLEFELATILDATEEFDLAFAALERAHKCLARLDQSVGAKVFDIEKLPWLNQCLTSQDAAQFKGHPTVSPPIFLVGFIRSGTTLLEQMLAAHPSIRTLDEKPALEAVIAKIESMGLRYPQDLVNLSEREVGALRQVYFAEVTKYVALQEGQQLVDKYPLNLARLPLIRLLFPNAKVLFVLRHPCDAVLSAYMQYFRLNNSALAFESLASTAVLYDRLLTLWKDQSAAMGLDTISLRYEDLVADAQTVMQTLLPQLSLDWNNAVLKPAAVAERKLISTPSYAQVAEPIHQRSVERWRSYEKHFSAALLILQPWVDRLGYRTSTAVDR